MCKLHYLSYSTEGLYAFPCSYEVSFDKYIGFWLNTLLATGYFPTYGWVRAILL